MAALSRPANVEVRAASPGEGRAVASLWRELWDAHEAWGGYPGSHDDRVYAQLASRLEEDARVRGGQPVLGRHVHLVATYCGEVAGQVEGWFERHGVEESTPFTCEVRSLIVRHAVRGAGVGAALLDVLAGAAQRMSRGAPVAMVAEVLEPNPAHTFYARVGYAPVSWNQRLPSSLGAMPPPRQISLARPADSRDALAIALLDGTLSARRRAAGDQRFDRPRSVDATLLGAIAAHLARGAQSGEPSELVATDARHDVKASATLGVALLDPPFLPVKRAMMGRVAADPACDPTPHVASLMALASRLAAARGAPTLEITDLTGPGTALYEAALRAGGRPWSRVVQRTIT